MRADTQCDCHNRHHPSTLPCAREDCLHVRSQTLARDVGESAGALSRTGIVCCQERPALRAQFSSKMVKGSNRPLALFPETVKEDRHPLDGFPGFVPDPCKLRVA